MRPEPLPLGVLLISAGHERAHYAFVVACAAAAMGRPVVLLATNQGCHALRRALPDWDEADRLVQNKGVAGLHALRDAASELGVRLLACDSGLALSDLDPADLLEEVEVTGVPTFLSAVGAAPVVTL